MDRIKNNASENFPYGHFIAMVGGKWKPYLMVIINEEGSVRFNETVKKLGVSAKVLSEQLKELERDGFIERIEGTDKKVQRVDYLLTEDGKRIIPILKDIYKWGIADMKKKNLYIDPRSYDYSKIQTSDNAEKE